MCLEVIERNPKIVTQYKSGKKKVFKALMGEVARNTNQCADMATVSKIMGKLLTE